MKNHLLLLITLTCLLLNISLIAQQYGWVKIAQLGTQYNNIYSVYFTDSLNGWVGMSHYIFRTTDSGKSWNNSVAELVPYSISVNKNNIGWVVGNASSLGRIYKTSNGGIDWLSNKDKDNRKYLSVNNSKKLLVNIAGHTLDSYPDTGKLAQSINDGNSWTERTIGDSITQLTKIQFIDSLNGWITTGPNSKKHAILKTTDGGINWEIIPTPDGFTAISFIDISKGWAIAGERARIYKTTNGGNNWQFQYAIEDSFDAGLYPSALSFTDSLNGWAFGIIFYKGDLAGGIYRTTTGGKTWYLEHAGLTRGINDAIMLDKYHGWAVGDGGVVLAYKPITKVIEQIDKLPTTFKLHQNYPNPFNSTTTIEYEIINKSNVQLKIYDITGREVKQLLNEGQQPGVYRINFDAEGLSSGVYTYTITATTERNEYTETKQMILIK